MPDWRNSSGRPLSSKQWLEIHHRAKLRERTEFVKRILRLEPKKIVDIGCGPGLWLGLIDEWATHDCEIVGIDNNSDAISAALEASTNWRQTASFLNADIDDDASVIPEADVFLAFNIFPYLRNPKALISTLKSKLTKNGTLVVRQYDGALLRVGPRAQVDRSLIDQALQASVLSSTQFRHYDMDNVFELLSSSAFVKKNIDFEMFRRFSPFDEATLDYIKGTIEWERSLVSEDAAPKLDSWLDTHLGATSPAQGYFMTIDLVAHLS